MIFFFQAIFGLIGTVLGTIATIGVLVNANSVSSLSTDQDSICTAAKQFGGFTCTIATSGSISAAETEACFTSLAGYNTPSCQSIFFLEKTTYSTTNHDELREQSKTKALGNTALSLTTISTGVLIDASQATAITTAFNKLQNAVNNLATPSC